MIAGSWAGIDGRTATTCIRSCAASCGAVLARTTGRLMAERMRAHFEPMPRDRSEKVERLDDLTPAIELYVSLIRLGRFDDAFGVFIDRLARADALSAQRVSAACGAS